MPFLDVQDVRIHYEFEQSSHKPVLLLSNSLGTDMSMWMPQLEAFAEHFSVLRYDSRGHGTSSVPPGAYSIESMGADVLGLLDALGHERVHFCGLSLGGMVGQWLAVNAADRIDRLVLSSTAAKIGTHEGWNARIETVEREGMDAIIPAVLKNWYTKAFQESSPEQVAETRSMLHAMDTNGYVASCAAVRDMDLREGVKKILAPTLIVYGTEDPVTPPEAAEELVASIAGARILPLAASHLANIEAPLSFTRGVLEFLLGDGETGGANG